MATEVKLPQLAEGIDTAEITNILVAVGDTVEEGQSVIEVETDKAAAEVPSGVAGVVEEILVKVGDQVEVGQVILTFVEAQVGSPVPAEKGEEPSKRPEEAASKEPKSEDEESAPEEPAPAPNRDAGNKPEPPERARAGTLAPAAPSVRRFAHEISIDIAEVTGSGPHGRVSRDDVKRFAKEMNEGRVPSAGAGVVAPPLPDFEAYGPVRRETMSKMRRRTAENMIISTSLVPHVTQCDDADVTQLESRRKRYASRAEAAGGKLTMTAILVKVVASALKKFPKFNASVDMQHTEIVYKSFYNVGVAVDTSKGLLVPVIKDVTSKNIIDIAVELTDISRRVREGKIRLDELEGGTFTISNVGGIGGTYFTPIVNYPEVAILGVGRAKEQPMRVGDAWKPRLILPLSLSYDHRVIDGAESIRFLRWIVDAIEEPLLLSLEG
jgi:pyruvate dehydrogenase E2 component (dihydrolipoamide acetyltransferase)